MPTKWRRRDSSLHGFPASPQTTPWGEILPDPEAGPVDPELLHRRLLVLYGRFIHQFFKNVLDLHGDPLKDVTQEFFLHVLEKETLKRVTYRDNFRGFLRLACRRFYINWVKSSRAKRRDTRRRESLGDRDLPADRSLIPEDRFFAIYDAAERKRYLDMAMEKVRDLLREDGQEAELDLLRDHVGADGREPEEYSLLTGKYGLSESEIRNRLTKVRKLLREALLALAAQRSKDPEGELRELGLHRYIANRG